jgi:hypothetical protein
MRIAALEALVDARGGAVSATVNALANDSDMLVRETAARLRGVI